MPLWSFTGTKADLAFKLKKSLFGVWESLETPQICIAAVRYGISSVAYQRSMLLLGKLCPKDSALAKFSTGFCFVYFKFLFKHLKPTNLKNALNLSTGVNPLK